MRKILLATSLVLFAAGSAHAQWGGSGGHGRREGPPSSSGAPSSAPSDHQNPAKAPVPTDEVVISGVVQGLGPEPDRVTIAYGAVDALAWPAGTTPFVVTNPSLLTGVTVGEKVRFKIESAHIYAIDIVN
jgi:Cu(I)/Ag(I) efflux system protein CusF